MILCKYKDIKSDPIVKFNKTVQYIRYLIIHRIRHFLSSFPLSETKQSLTIIMSLDHFMITAKTGLILKLENCFLCLFSNLLVMFSFLFFPGRNIFSCFFSDFPGQVRTLLYSRMVQRLCKYNTVEVVQTSDGLEVEGLGVGFRGAVGVGVRGELGVGFRGGLGVGVRGGMV